jgi:hypothetical protein
MLSFVINNIYSYDTFLCVDGPLRIRKEPDLQSERIGVLNTYDTAQIILKNNNKTIIDNIEDYWYKIKIKDLEGYVFGGYGIELKEQYDVQEIDDIIKIFPDKFKIIKSSRNCYQDKYNIAIFFYYYIEFMNHEFLVKIFFEPADKEQINEICSKFNFEYTYGVTDTGYSNFDFNYNMKECDAATSNHNSYYKYWFGLPGHPIGGSIALFLFAKNIEPFFRGISINVIWPYMNKNVPKDMNNEFVFKAKNNRQREVLLFIIFDELAKRMKIGN